MRSYLLSVHYTFCPELASTNFHPRFWSLGELVNNPQIGLPDLNGAMTYPTRLNLSSEKLDRFSVFLLENGLDMFLWVGKSADPNLVAALFGTNDINQLHSGKVKDF